MIRLIFGALALVALGALGSSAQKQPVREPEPEELSGWMQWRLRRRFEKMFSPLPGDRLIEIDEDARSRPTVIRRYRPCMRPCPWELKSATTQDGVEQFSLSFGKELAVHPGLTPYLTIRPIDRRPIDVPKDFACDTGSDLARDSYFAHRRRYLHMEEGPVSWFIVRVRTRFGVEWIFEHPSLFAELIRERPALPPPTPKPRPPAAPAAAPKRAADKPSYEDLLNALFEQGTKASAAAMHAKESAAKADQLLASMDKLRAEIPELVKPRRKTSTKTNNGVNEQLKQLKKVNSNLKRARAVVDTLDAFDEDARGNIENALGLAADKAIEDLGNAIQGNTAEDI